MPTPTDVRKTGLGSAREDQVVLNKIIGTFTDIENTDDDIRMKMNRCSVSFVSGLSYETDLSTINDDQYADSAGVDVSDIFLPYSSATTGNIPHFNAGAANMAGSGQVVLKDLLPFEWDTDAGDSYDRWNDTTPNTDNARGYVTGATYPGPTNRYRDPRAIRGIGLRLPIMGVGWGHDLAGSGYPVASGSTADPSVYAVGPIDFRYDTNRHVWTCASANNMDFFLGVVTGSASGIGGSEFRWAYAWYEGEFNGDNIERKQDGREGTTTTHYALNMSEAFHDNTHIFGANVLASDYSSFNVAPCPIGGTGNTDTHQYDVPVLMLETVDVNQDRRYWIVSIMGSHDGSCS